MNTRPLRALALIAVFLVIASAAYLMMQPGNETATIGAGETVQPRLLQYNNETYGLHFSYPDTYVLTERDEPGSGERAHHAIILMDRIAATHIPEGGEGPTTINIDIFGNDVDKLSVDSWIKNTSISNFKLSVDQTLSSTTVSGLPGMFYRWDGLYRGESVVVAHGSDIVMLSVTSLDTTDRIRDHFRSLLASVHLD